MRVYVYHGFVHKVCMYVMMCLCMYVYVYVCMCAGVSRCICVVGGFEVRLVVSVRGCPDVRVSILVMDCA